jgi:hypothetical protein
LSDKYGRTSKETAVLSSGSHREKLIARHILVAKKNQIRRVLALCLSIYVISTILDMVCNFLYAVSLSLCFSGYFGFRNQVYVASSG